MAVILLVLIGSPAGLTSCSSAAPASTAEPDGRPPAHRLRVGLTEWTIAVSPSRAAAGRVVLVVTNAGGTEHDLVVRGRAGSWATPRLDPGRRTTLVVRARAGELLHLWCSITGHRTQGMDTHLPVAAR